MLSEKDILKAHIIAALYHIGNVECTYTDLYNAVSKALNTQETLQTLLIGYSTAKGNFTLAMEELVNEGAVAVVPAEPLYRLNRE